MLDDPKNTTTGPYARPTQEKDKRTKVRSQSHQTTVLRNEGEALMNEEIGKPKLTPFFLTHIVGDKLLHNSMIKFRASTIVMPKQIVEVLKLEYDLLHRGFMQLNGNKLQVIGVIRNLLLTLYAFPSIIVLQEVMTIDILLAL